VTGCVSNLTLIRLSHLPAFHCSTRTNLLPITTHATQVDRARALFERDMLRACADHDRHTRAAPLLGRVPVRLTPTVSRSVVVFPAVRLCLRPHLHSPRRRTAGGNLRRGPRQACPGKPVCAALLGVAILACHLAHFGAPTPCHPNRQAAKQLCCRLGEAAASLQALQTLDWPAHLERTVPLLAPPAFSLAG